jgi:hypothetical protein
MTLENTLAERLSEWRPAAGRQDLHVSADSWAATVTADRSDVLGCLVWELNLRRDGTQGADIRGWGTAVAERVSGLMEPLRVVEVDTTRDEAQLRSEAPLQRGDKRFYYELLLRGNATAALRRFQAVNGNGKREQVSFALTHEVLAKLAGDIAVSA